MSEDLRLSILSPERRLVEQVLVKEVTLQGSEGQIGIFPGHAPMMGTLEVGIFEYHSLSENEPVQGVISSGFFQVKDNTIVVLAETIELKGEIDVNRAKKAQRLSEETLEQACLDDMQFKKYQLKLQRALIRQQLANSSKKG
jgi:F-type H+-transporting ATPase subunit epsilon